MSQVLLPRNRHALVKSVRKLTRFRNVLIVVD